jgi:hypothetical protein
VVFDGLHLAKGLISQDALPPFTAPGSNAQEQVARLWLLAEENREVSLVIAASDVQQITAIASSAGIALDPEVASVLAQPQDLDDAQLEQVVSGIDPVTAQLITTGIAAIMWIATIWIDNHCDTKIRIAEIEAGKTSTI